MFTSSKAIKNREKRTNCIQSRTIRRRRAGSRRSLRAHSTTSDVEDVSTPRVSQAVPMKPNYIIRIYQIASPNFEILCSAFFQESAFPVPRSPLPQYIKIFFQCFCCPAFSFAYHVFDGVSESLPAGVYYVAGYSYRAPDRYAVC